MALRESYGYEPCALSTTAPGKALEDGLVFCRVRSRLTGRRLVSLPFSDHAQPLASGEGLQELLTGFERERAAGAWRYAEVRPIVLDNTDISAGKGYGQGDRYFLHRLDLQPSLESLFSGFHKSCVQRAIKRAQKGEVRTKSGNAPELLRLFYRLMVQTRRRHRLPPQPFGWFESLSRHLGEKLRIRVALLGERPISAIVTLTHRDTIVYKYGCSDESYFNQGGIFLLFWEMIQEAKSAGVKELDLGRSDLDGPGLIQFKDRWGARRMEMIYYRSPGRKDSGHSSVVKKLGFLRKGLGLLPDSALILIGKALYRHTG